MRVLFSLLALTPSLLTQAVSAEIVPKIITLETHDMRYSVASDGQNKGFLDKATGKDYLSSEEPSPMAMAKKAGQTLSCTSVTQAQGKLVLGFENSEIQAELRVKTRSDSFVLEVVSVKGDPEEITFLNIPLRLKGQLDEPFAGCALALNLQTNVSLLPGPQKRLEAIAYARFGFQGAQVAVIGCQPDELREAMKRVIQDAPELPQSRIAGPWAPEGRINRGSYLFDFGQLTEKTVQDWIALAKKFGINQIDFHTGTSLRFGDCEPNPDLFPGGLDSVKSVIDELHKAGISAGLHTYAFFIAKNTPYVTPKPDPRLGKDATFTLSEDLSADSLVVPVVESTDKMSTTTGFFVRNSVTLQIDDELITYAGIRKEPPFAFSECVRGALGTQVSAHAKGAQVHHLKECFGLFCPDADSTLLSEVAANTARAYNTAGFDMIYLDALDGEDILAGYENAWHYGSLFAFEIAKRLDKPALFEMSTFHHHLWFIRARMGAWDCSSRSHKRYVDVHCEANSEMAGTFLPMSLGWWNVKVWDDGPFGPQNDPTFPDDIEYLLCKGLGHDWGFALMGVDPKNIGSIPSYERLAPIFRQYEELRHKGVFPESIKARLREPKSEFTLEQDEKGQWRFRSIQYAKHKVQDQAGPSSAWILQNPFQRQPLRVRIQALMSCQPYGAPEGRVIEDFSQDGTPGRSAPGVQAALASSQETMQGIAPGGRYSATDPDGPQNGAWSHIERTFSPPLNISGSLGLGLWVRGDKQGELLNIQSRSPEHTVYGGFGDHYIPVDFEGWQYFELVEPESERIQDQAWPYKGAYGIFREFVDYTEVAKLSFWYNLLPNGREVNCLMSPIKALPLVKAKLIHPSMEVNGKSIRFPVIVESGCTLEFSSPSDCKLYGPKGEVLQVVTPEGEVPWVETGDNAIRYNCQVEPTVRGRANVTVITRGEPLREE